MKSIRPWMLRPSYWRDLWTNLRLTWHIVFDRRVPLYLKLIPLLVAVYILFPIDFIPGFIPILGQMDDLAVLILGTQIFLRLAPNEIIAEYERLPQESTDAGQLDDGESDSAQSSE